MPIKTKSLKKNQKHFYTSWKDVCHINRNHNKIFTIKPYPQLIKDNCQQKAYLARGPTFVTEVKYSIGLD